MFFRIICLSIFLISTAQASVFIRLNVPNGQSESSLPYRDHTYTYYIYASNTGPLRCDPPQQEHIFRLGQYYEDKEGQYSQCGLLEDVSAFVGESNCVSLIVTAGSPGLESKSREISGAYVTKTPFLLSDLGTSLALPYSFNQTATAH